MLGVCVGWQLDLAVSRYVFFLMFFFLSIGFRRFPSTEDGLERRGEV